jgi:hypothetical protein
MYINNSYKIKKRKEIIHLCIYFNYRSVNLYTKIIYMYYFNYVHFDKNSCTNTMYMKIPKLIKQQH